MPPNNPPIQHDGRYELSNDIDFDRGAVKGDVVTFSVEKADPSAPAVGATEWDFNYQPGGAFNVTASTPARETSFQLDSVGSRLVAARFTPSGEGSPVISYQVLNVIYPEPEVTMPPDGEVSVEEGVNLSAASNPEAGIRAVEWSYSLDGDEYRVIGSMAGQLTGHYDLPGYGEYEFKAVVTATDGQSGEGSYKVNAKPKAPTGQLSIMWPDIDEGVGQQFALVINQPDLSNETKIEAKWDAESEFLELTHDEVWVDNGVARFAHLYSDGKASPAVTATIRLVDETGLSFEQAVTFNVKNRAPTGRFKAGALDAPIATRAVSGQEVWWIKPGEEIAWQDSGDPSPEDAAELVYIWTVDGVLDPTENAPVFALSDDLPGKPHSLRATITDKDGGVLDTGVVMIAVAGDDYGSPEGGSAFPGAAGIFGWLTDGAETPPENYNRFTQYPVIQRDVTPGENVTVKFRLDEATRNLWTAAGEPPITYHFQINGETSNQIGSVTGFDRVIPYRGDLPQVMVLAHARFTLANGQTLYTPWYYVWLINPAYNHPPSADPQPPAAPPPDPDDSWLGPLRSMINSVGSNVDRFLGAVGTSQTRRNGRPLRTRSS